MKNLLMIGLTIVLLSSCYIAEAQSGGGAIQGKILYSGTPPKASLISMAKDPNCLKINAGKKIYEESFVVGTGGEVKNVFVHLKSGLAKKSYPAPAQPVVLDQQGCIYHPRVQGALIGQTLKILNSDQTLHNIHSQSPKYMLNIAQPIAGMAYDLPLKTEEVMLAFRCEIHPWMIGYVGVLPHPFFSVTGAAGAYEIKNVPPGKYVVQAWHEQLGATTKEVEVKAGGTVNLDFTFNAKSSSANDGFGPQDVFVPPGEELTLQTRMVSQIQ